MPAHARRAWYKTAPMITTPQPFSGPAVVVEPQRGVQVMRFPPGRMDGHALRQMYELTVAQINRPNARLMIDLTGVTQVSSAGLGMFVTLRKKCLGVGAQMHIVIPDPQLWEMFTIMRLEIVLPLFRERDEAFTRFKPTAAPA